MVPVFPSLTVSLPEWISDFCRPGSLFASLDDKQKAVFIQEMVKLSHERGLD